MNPQISNKSITKQDTPIFVQKLRLYNGILTIPYHNGSKTEIMQSMSVQTKLSRCNGMKSKKIGVIVKIKFFRRDGVKSGKNWRDGVNFGSAGGASSNMKLLTCAYILM